MPAVTLPHVFGPQTGPIPLRYLDDNFNALLQVSGGSVSSVAGLRLLPKTGPGLVYVTGYRTTGDGGQGYFYYVASDTSSPDDGGLVIVAADGGRWYRFYGGPINAAMFGYVADANPATGVSAGGYGASNVTAINAMQAACFASRNAPGFAAGGFGGQGVIPPGYGEIAGTMPIIINPASLVVGCGQYVTVLCGPTHNPSVVMADGNTLSLGSIYFGVNGSPYSSVPGYPTGVKDLTLNGFGISGSGINVNSNTAEMSGLWVTGYANSGVVLQNEDTTFQGTVEFCGTAATLAPFSFGNKLDVLVSECPIGVTANNRKWYSVASTGNTGGTTPAVVIAANQGLNTGYTFNGNAVPAANFTGMRVTVQSGTGKGQTGHVTASSLSNSTWQFTLTLASDSGSWTALDATSKVVIFNAGMENIVRLRGQNVAGLFINCVESYGNKFIAPTLSFTSTTIPNNGAVYIGRSENISIIDIGAKATGDYRVASTTVSGVNIDSGCRNIRLSGGALTGWKFGISQPAGSVTDGLIMTGISCTDNAVAGASILDGARGTITGCDFSNNGSSGTPGTGLIVVWPESNANLLISGNTADSYVFGAAAYQTTGFAVAPGTATSYVTVIGNSSYNHTTANYAFTNHTEAINTGSAMPPTKLITNYFSAGGTYVGPVAPSATGGATIASGALTAGVLAQVLSVTGSGEVPMMGLLTADATLRTIRLQVIVDGTTVFDATSGNIASNATGIFAAGAQIASSGPSLGTVNDVPIRFSQSLVVNIASSLTETGRQNFIYNLHKT